MGVGVIDLLHTLKARRSIHHFKDLAVPTNTLKEIFTYASWAPTHYMKEPWQIKLYQDEGKHVLIEAIIRSYQRLGMMKTDDAPKTKKSIQFMKDFLYTIPHHALIFFEKEADPIRYEEEYAAVCAFIQNAQLAAWDYEVGMLWTITPYMHDPQFAEEIGLHPQEVKIAAVMQIGYAEKIPPAKARTPIEEKLEIISQAANSV